MHCSINLLKLTASICAVSFPKTVRALLQKVPAFLQNHVLIFPDKSTLSIYLNVLVTPQYLDGGWSVGLLLFSLDSLQIHNFTTYSFQIEIMM